ncbi:MAG: glycoside hydrolase family 38 C-terminal domain-containing protein [Anaerolineae bacterium]|nr:glycoside hydrolase family 38 C-terminal domain-containing protein [Anaerolineae bacterium]
MTLTPEWRRRVERWCKILRELWYRPLGEVALEGFTTFEYLPAEAAGAGPFQPMPPGTPWGAKWEYAWFRGELVLPAEAAGQRCVLCLESGGESLIWIDGRPVGARDWAHKALTLTRAGAPGTRYRLLVESYGGHGPMVEGGGPAPHGVETVPEPPATQRTVGHSTFGIWDEVLFQLALDVQALFELREKLEPASLRVVEIDRALQEITLLVDLEAPRAELLRLAEAGRAALKPLLECVNGSTAPELIAFGHGHLDVAWLWPLQETERKMGRTVANQLALMDEYPDYIFLQSQAQLCRMLAQRYPELTTRFKEKVRAGQMIVEGGTWVEPDTNLTSGESLIRQFIHGKRFFREEFGMDSQFFWEPDVFGYSGALPQILRGCGIKYFGTQKIFWAYNGGDPFPYNEFIWEGIDGSEVIAHIFHGYGYETSPAHLVDAWRNRAQQSDTAALMLPFGWGDGGGGPTREHVEFALRARDLEGAPRVRMTGPGAFFEMLEARGGPKRRYVGEIYFQAHRGTYTSQARTKRNNRRSELTLREAEYWGSVARALVAHPLPLAQLDAAWKTVLLNQFHDILPGSSIERVYAEAEQQHAAVIAEAQAIAHAAASSLTQPARVLTVFNSLSWSRTALVPLPESAAQASGQRFEGRTWAEVELPACGWRTVTPDTFEAGTPASGGALRVEPCLLENEFLRVTFNEVGEITSCLDKSSGRELAAAPGNVFHLYRDVPTWFDAWDIDSMVKDAPVELSREAVLEVVAEGSLFGALRLTRRLHASTLTQIIRLRRGSRCLEFETVVDWRERHKLLKVAFPVTIHAEEAVHEIQFGHLRRPTHASRPFDADRFEVSAHKWSALLEEGRGVALLNDSKYGLDVTGNTFNLTLLKAALAPDSHADQGEQRFTYALTFWNGSFFESDVIREAYELNVPALVVEGAAATRSLFTLSAPNVILETVKPAEDGSADIILRLYEAKRTATRCTLETDLPLKAVMQTNMLEETEAPLACAGGSIPLDFRPFEIKTLRLVF